MRSSLSSAELLYLDRGQLVMAESPDKLAKGKTPVRHGLRGSLSLVSMRIGLFHCKVCGRFHGRAAIAVGPTAGQPSIAPNKEKP